jgi:micrococcal nuclease
MRLLGIFGFAALLVIALAAALMPEAPAAVVPSETVSGAIRVLDGDTVAIGGRHIRMADIDAPELFSPKCASEKALAVKAKDRLTALVASGPLTLSGTGHDRYGRDLRIIAHDGRSLGATLVAEGLARNWDGGRRPWC